MPAVPPRAVLLASLLALAACEQTTVEVQSTGTSTASLSRLGFRPAATRSDGTPSAMRYQGKITSAVFCKRSGGGYQSGPAVLPGARLDAYVMLSDGRVADGVYAITVRDGSGVSGISFNPRETGTFGSGVTCRAA
jgi:hypothetical protein